MYGYHLILLACAFTVAAAFAVMTHRLALINLLNFYFAHPFTDIVGSLLLIYCPPLLDILPMYVIFLLITPFLLAIAVNRGWKGILLTSGSVWFLAQFGQRAWVHHVVVRVTTLHIPLQDTGSFSLFAWQMVSGQPGWASAPSPPRKTAPSGGCPVSFIRSAPLICIFSSVCGTTGLGTISLNRR
jgi:hypothetical protein